MTNLPDKHRINAPLASHQRAPGASSYKSYSPSSTPLEFIEVDTAALRGSRLRQRSRFLKGPIPLDEVAKAARLPGKALAVFLAIRHRADLTRSETITLPRSLMQQFCVQKDAKARALCALERARLVRVERKTGRSPTITLTTNNGDEDGTA